MRSAFFRRWSNPCPGRPGRRFRDRYERNRRRTTPYRWLGQLLRLLLALVCFCIGVVLAFVPGPAIVFFFLAGALIASDWRWAAVVLDWLEVRLRRVGRWAARVWRRLPLAGRVALLLAGTALSAASTYSFYLFVRR